MTRGQGGNRAERRAAAAGRAPRGATAADRYGSRTIRRALLPGIIAAGALLIGVLLIGDGWYLIIEYVVAILAAVMAVFAVQARAWWWLPVLTAAVVWWNPVLPLDLPAAARFLSHPAGAILLFAAGATIRERTRG